MGPPENDDRTHGLAHGEAEDSDIAVEDFDCIAAGVRDNLAFVPLLPVSKCDISNGR